MTTALIGEARTASPSPSARKALLIGAQTHANLQDLLFEPYMRGVGHTEFIQRAIDRAREEADEQGANEPKPLPGQLTFDGSQSS